jgi:hypothetical protein
VLHSPLATHVRYRRNAAGRAATGGEGER